MLHTMLHPARMMPVVLCALALWMPLRHKAEAAMGGEQGVAEDAITPDAGWALANGMPVVLWARPEIQDIISEELGGMSYGIIFSPDGKVSTSGRMPSSKSASGMST